MGLRQADVGAVGLIDHATVSDVERGRRRLAPDVARRLSEQLDDGRLAMAVAEEATGGADSPWLDGPAVDLSRAATWAKGLEELEEALTVGQQALRYVLRAPTAVDDAGREQILAALMEIVEAITAARHVVAIACREYGISYRGLWEAHRAELARKGYLRTMTA